MKDEGVVRSGAKIVYAVGVRIVEFCELLADDIGG
jgi:hypothetical protein